MSDASDSGSGDESILNSGSSGIDGAQGGTDSDSYSDEIPFQTPKTKNCVYSHKRRATAAKGPVEGSWRRRRDLSAQRRKSALPIQVQ